MPPINLDRLRSILTSTVFAAVVAGFFATGRIISPPALLVGERRVPASLPRLSFETVITGEFTGRFDNYIADSFPFRDAFRTISSAMVFGMLLQADKNGLYMDAYGAGRFAAIDSGSVRLLSEKIKNIAEFLDDVNIYYSFIPDKSIYSNRDMPGFDPHLTRELLAEGLRDSGFSFVDITGALGAESFYRTDLHWDQTKIEAVVDVFGEAMEFSADLSRCSTSYAGELKGVYSGQLALPIGTDSIYYLSNPDISASYLSGMTGELEPGPVYDPGKLAGIDAYDFFLSGAQPLIILENSESRTDRELYLFRDSFSSSLAPLLAGAYSKVVLIDLRYIDMQTVKRYIEFKQGSDALFLYSTLVLNNSDILLA